MNGCCPPGEIVFDTADTRRENLHYIYRFLAAGIGLCSFNLSIYTHIYRNGSRDECSKEDDRNKIRNVQKSHFT